MYNLKWTRELDYLNIALYPPPFPPAYLANLPYRAYLACLPYLAYLAYLPFLPCLLSSYILCVQALRAYLIAANQVLSVD